MSNRSIADNLRKPANILMLKGHSAGIGDLLRSSAAWRALHNHFPGARLHLWFLTKEPGYPSEELIRRHHLLGGFHVAAKSAGWPKLLSMGRQLVREIKPELIIDFETAGIRTSLLAMWMRFWAGGKSLGIAQVPPRGWFYSMAAPARETYAKSKRLPTPLEYTERDFVALAALGIERKGTAIELRESEEGAIFRKKVEAELNCGQQPILGLNIGCGTPDAVVKRPDLGLLVSLVRELVNRHGFRLMLTGARYEQEVNREFISLLKPAQPVLDLSGRTSMLELTGAIAACRLFISSDSGPYHMAVGLRVPTLAIFKWPNPEHYHAHPWVKCMVAPGPPSGPVLLEAAEELLSSSPALPSPHRMGGEESRTNC